MTLNVNVTFPCTERLLSNDTYMQDLQELSTILYDCTSLFLSQFGTVELYIQYPDFEC